ncbi:hypothetical protein BJY59DRAFT_696453, partial [Rhodotorula toruloides]
MTFGASGATAPPKRLRSRANKLTVKTQRLDRYLLIDPQLALLPSSDPSLRLVLRSERVRTCQPSDDTLQTRTSHLGLSNLNLHDFSDHMSLKVLELVASPMALSLDLLRLCLASCGTLSPISLGAIRLTNPYPRTPRHPRRRPSPSFRPSQPPLPPKPSSNRP